MAPDTRRRISALAFLFLPLGAWLATGHYLGVISRSTFTIERLTWLSVATPRHPLLIGSLVMGVLLAMLITAALRWRQRTNDFAGAPYKRFVRGTQVVGKDKLVKMCTEPKEQLSIAGIPMPTEIETLHLLIAGATGSGKSVLLRELTYSARKRGDRMFVVDPNGDLLSRFGRPGDVILNPYDERTAGWSFFNEIRADYDWHRFAYSMVPLGNDANAEEWNGFGRLLLRETAKKLALMGNPSIHELFRWCTIAGPEDLRAFLTGTLAESLFVGSSEASKALSSARFVLSNKLSEHLSMPDGAFSIRDWMADPNGGSLFVTWREDMAKAMKPLVSTWTDVFCTSILSLPEGATCRTRTGRSRRRTRLAGQAAEPARRPDQGPEIWLVYRGWLANHVAAGRHLWRKTSPDPTGFLPFTRRSRRGQNRPPDGRGHEQEPGRTRGRT